MNIRPRSLMANIVSGTLTVVMVLGLAYFIYERQDSFSLFSPAGDIQSDQPAMPKPMASERIDAQQVENEVNRIAEEKRKIAAEKKAAEEKRRVEEVRKKAEAEAKRKADLAKRQAEEAKRKADAEAAEKKRLNEIALKKKQEEDKKKKEEDAHQQKLAAEKQLREVEKKKEEDRKKKEEKVTEDQRKAAADQKAKEKAAVDKKVAEEKRKAEEVKKAADAKSKADADAKAKAASDAKAKAEAAENDRIANAYLGNASFVGAMQQALYNNWSPAVGSEGLAVTIVFYVDQNGTITKIDEAKSKFSGYPALDASVKAAVMKTKKIKMPDNQHAVNKLVKEGVAVTFDPRDYSFGNY